MNNEKLLSHSETLELIAKAKQKDKNAMEKLIVYNTALVKSLAVKFTNRGIDYDDLVQIGSIGLVKAVYNFDTSFNVRFSTYAVPMILGEIKRFLRDDGSIKVSRSLKETVSKAMKASEELKTKLGREPSIKEISEHIEISTEDIIFALDSAKTPLSLYEKAYDNYSSNNSSTLLDTLVDKDQSENINNKILLKQLLIGLSKRDRQLIILRYFQDKTQTEVAKLMDISQVQVSRLENKILSNLRKIAQ